MNCIKCQNEMIKAKLNTHIAYYGEEKRNLNGTIYQNCYVPIISYVCEECGYMEFYCKDIETENA